MFTRFLTDGTADTSFGEAGRLEAKKVFPAGQGTGAGYFYSWATSPSGESTIFAYDSRLPQNRMWVDASKLDANGRVTVNTKPFKFVPDDRRMEVTYVTPGPYSSGAIYVVSELWGKHDIFGLPMISRIVIR